MVGRGWMSGASIEETLELWASSLRDVKARMRSLFTQERVAASAGLFVDGLLGEERRKTGWMRAEAAGDPGPWRQQAILGRGRWDADALRDIVRAYMVETLAEPDAVLVVDETGFLKQGKASCGVARCESAWNKDPVFGVIGIQTGPRGRRVHSGFHGGHGSRFWAADSGDHCEDPAGGFRPGEADQGDLPRVSGIAEGGAQGGSLAGDRVPVQARLPAAAADRSVAQTAR